MYVKSLVTLFALGVFSIVCQPVFAQNPEPIKNFPVVKIVPDFPMDIDGGADKATLANASVFAWQEFIALCWPAGDQQGRPGQRGAPDTTKVFGDPSYDGPVVWETFRSKVEIFPGPGHQPNGYNESLPDNGYDILPQYNYQSQVPPCKQQQPVTQPAWINLDETTQIGLNTIYAGVLDGVTSTRNSDPARIRFLAKANRTYYKYVTDNQFWNFGGDYYQRVQNFRNAINNPQGQPPSSDQIIEFPSGTVMVKAAWRLASPDDDLSRFHTSKVRYYESASSGSGDPDPCYNESDSDETWVLIALHIVHKTPTAPYFTFATFEQADNLLTQDGKSVEELYGYQLKRFANQSLPSLTYLDGYNSQIGPDPRIVANGPFVTDPGKALYYKNLAGGSPKDPTGKGGIVVQTRAYPLPSDIITANVLGLQAIKYYLTQHGIDDSPWLYYKLINIQYAPFNKTDIDPESYSFQPATYYQANSVVESNYSLSNFTGAQVPPGSPYQGNTTNYNNDGSQPVENVFVPSGNHYDRFNMGGCMGCHGQAQKQGNDFSFVLAGGPNRFPEFPETKENLAEKYQVSGDK